jgi:N-acetylglucosaminyldiphosphoundecaprenol N-acetyl-beta-D-mannosaminyltransferase
MIDRLVRCSTNEPTTVRFVNAYTLACASSSPEYAALLSGPGINVPDGKPLARWLDRHRLGDRLGQVRGPEVFERVLDQGRSHSLRHYFLGTTPDTLLKLLNACDRKFPGVEIVGHESPPFRELTDDDIREVVERVKSCSPDIIWVAIGTPRQDMLAHRLMRETGVTTAAVGAAFDFTAGTAAIAPKWVSRVYGEWLFRLIKEPRRLGRRYLWGNTRFLRLVFNDWQTLRRSRDRHRR